MLRKNSEDRRQETEFRRHNSELRRQETEYRRQNSFFRYLGKGEMVWLKK